MLSNKMKNEENYFQLQKADEFNVVFLREAGNNIRFGQICNHAI